MNQLERSRARHLLQQALQMIFLGLVIVSPILHLRTVAHLIPEHFSDLFPLWNGARAALDGQDPYSAQVSRQNQTYLYSHPLAPGDPYDKQAFVYPAPTVLLLAPLTWASWPNARLIFTIGGPLCVALAAWFWIQISGLSLSRRHTIVLIILISCSWPAIWGYRVQQILLPLFAFASAACFLLRRNRLIGAGALLAIAALKTQVTGPLILWLLFVAIIEHRWRFIAAFTATLTALILAAEALLPGWISHWYAAVLTYGHEPSRQSLLTLIFHRPVGLAITALLGIWVCVLLIKLGPKLADPMKFTSAAALVLAFTACIIPTSLWMAFNPLLLIPAIVVFLNAYRKPAPPVVALALAVASFEVLAAPFCVLLSLFTGYRLFLAWLPFFGAFVPVILTLALAFVVQRGSLSSATAP